MYVKIVETNRIFTDKTGKFPKKGSKGGQYIIIIYCYDYNIFLAELIKITQKMI